MENKYKNIIMLNVDRKYLCKRNKRRKNEVKKGNFYNISLQESDNRIIHVNGEIYYHNDESETLRFYGYSYFCDFFYSEKEERKMKLKQIKNNIN